MHALDQTNAATAFLLTLPRPVRKEEAVARCCAHLMTEHDMARDHAGILALQAFAELQAMNQTTWVDLDASTAHLVVIRQATGATLALTLTDLMRLVRHESLSHQTVTAATTH
ncbi:hypothetical protein [Larsenimonas rhizosphaerae]|uniref:hypothetical protein n=1 Tax=Larsenimonas rhizosphaerae TaxID=2944682 RepID=UPI0020332547|nr:hypothetical protein [Larsenimonas rhizosphaerae]MCM2131436.1 hypothetical protein [Larsenimonas rhizosphaerae]